MGSGFDYCWTLAPWMGQWWQSLVPSAVSDSLKRCPYACASSTSSPPVVWKWPVFTDNAHHPDRLANISDEQAWWGKCKFPAYAAVCYQEQQLFKESWSHLNASRILFLCGDFPHLAKDFLSLHKLLTCGSLAVCLCNYRVEYPFM